MSTTPDAPSGGATLAPIGLGPGEGENLWFLGILVTIKSTKENTGGTVAVIEHFGPKDSGSPLHVHQIEDEWFYVLEGHMAFMVGDEVIDAPAGSFIFGPKKIPHTFTVRSETARWLLVSEPAGFEHFMRTFATPAERLEIPPADGPPPDFEALTALAKEYQIEIVGPPGIPNT